MKNAFVKGRVVAISVLILFSMLLSGCDFLSKYGDEEKRDEDNIDNYKVTVLESGFIPSRYMEDSFFAGFRTTVNIFDIDNVIVDFYYGVYFIYDEETERKVSHNIPSFDLYFTERDEKQNNPKEILIKHVDENLVSEKYKCFYVRDEITQTSKMQYNHYETHTIPSEMFTKDEGMIYFVVRGEDINECTPYYRSLTSINIYYRVIGDKVVLSQIPFFLLGAESLN